MNKKNKKSKKELKGIGGWLILLLITLVIYSLITLGASLVYIVEGTVLLFILVLIAFIGSVISLIFMFAKNKNFPLIIIILFWYGYAIQILQIALDPQDVLTNLRDALRGVWIIILWHYYLVKSRRVKNTFIK